MKHLIRYILLGALCLPALTAQAATDRHYCEADGKSDTYKMLLANGFYPEYTGDLTLDPYMLHPEYKHITQLWNAELNKYVFAFDIHIDYQEGGRVVTDGNQGELVDRQRNEIKCMHYVPGTFAKNGETITYRWKFVVPEGMKTTSDFCHIHQIKGLGSTPEVRHPVFTLTCRTKKGKQVLQNINVPYEGSSNVYLAEVDLVPIMGHWLEATEVMTVGKHGKYRMILKDLSTGKTLMDVNKGDIEVWRETTDASSLRGKWGIYRSLGEGLTLMPELRSERMLFADFEAVMGDATTGLDAVEATAQDDVLYNLMGQPVNNPQPGVYIRGGKKILITNLNP